MTATPFLVVGCESTPGRQRSCRSRDRMAKAPAPVLAGSRRDQSEPRGAARVCGRPAAVVWQRRSAAQLHLSPVCTAAAAAGCGKHAAEADDGQREHAARSDPGVAPVKAGARGGDADNGGGGADCVVAVTGETSPHDAVVGGVPAVTFDVPGVRLRPPRRLCRATSRGCARRSARTSYRPVGAGTS